MRNIILGQRDLLFLSCTEKSNSRFCIAQFKFRNGGPHPHLGNLSLSMRATLTTLKWNLQIYILFQQGQIMKRNHTTIMKRITSQWSCSSILRGLWHLWTPSLSQAVVGLHSAACLSPQSSPSPVPWDNCEVQQRQKETTSWRRNNNETGQKQTDSHTPIETDWETNNGKMGEGKLSGNLWVKEDIGGVRFEISDRQHNDSLALCSLERKY